MKRNNIIRHLTAHSFVALMLCCVVASFAQTDALDYGALARNRADLPPEVTLKQPVTMPIVVNGQTVGEVEIQAGEKLKLLEVRATGELTVGFENRSVVVPASRTDFPETMRALLRVRAEAQRIAAKEAAERERLAAEEVKTLAEQARKKREEAALKAQAEFRELFNGGDLEKIKSALRENPQLVAVRDPRGATPLHWAAETDKLELVELLLAARADVGAKTKTNGTPLHYAQSRAIAELLIARGADVNAKGAGGMTPLHTAAWSGNTGKAVALLANKADINARDDSGRTPLHLAAWSANKSFVEFLVAHKADVNAKDAHGRTPLHQARRYYGKDIVPILVKHGGKE
jgi:hypothetical protein